jgi:lysophospholipid acyltransferase (LPLAT)-like uncharacterized protein
MIRAAFTLFPDPRKKLTEKKQPPADHQLSIIKKNVLVPIAYWIIRLYLSVIRIRVINEEALISHLEKGGKAIVSLWHQRFFGVIGYAKKFSIYEPSAIISKSRDGELIAQVALRLGFRPIRGSSSRGGREAMAALVEDLAENSTAVHGVDGPRGPKGVVKAGLIRIAQLSRATIFPVYISVDRAWVLKSWDRFLIPKPFSRILIRWGDPIIVPAQMSRKTFEDLRLDVENRMIRGHAAGDRGFGWKNPL